LTVLDTVGSTSAADLLALLLERGEDLIEVSESGKLQGLVPHRGAGVVLNILYEEWFGLVGRITCFDASLTTALRHLRNDPH